MDITYYPERILPHVEWTDHFKATDIIKANINAMIGRKIVGTIDCCIDSSLGEGNLKIRDQYLASDDVPNLSTSLLGTCFLVEDFIYWQKEEGERHWTGEEISLEKFTAETDYYKEPEDMFVVGWKIVTIHNRSIPYKRTLPKMADYKNLKDKLKEKYISAFEVLPLDGQGRHFIEMEGESRVNHDPTNLNYWHYTVDIYPEDSPENPLKSDKGAWRLMMCENVADFLRRSFCLINDDSDYGCIENWKNLVLK